MVRRSGVIAMENLRRAAKVLGLPLGEVTWRSRVIRMDREALALANKELGKLNKEQLERYCICVAAVSKIDFDAFGDPLLRKHCKDIRKKLYEHDVVETAIDCIARSRR
jgi:hypothetical protein